MSSNKIGFSHKTIGFSGTVVSGRKIGKTLGFPTANILTDQKVSLLNGVYGVRIHVKGQIHYGVMNIGRRPSFQLDNHEVSCEVHIFHFSQSIYKEDVEVTVCFFVREEKTFPSIEDLILQIKNDIKDVKEQFVQSGYSKNRLLKIGS
ncbi:riboflavin kinase [Domibacillus epiphyticus]|uniref:riboflavin kinase n=1 Tax=Domibacillus epiphyticus TaxID=1714355 RepID=A0A1V2A6K7_9BACI|nr:riboflavin kinase [Domibacillus epiphyticus]OMP66502.1 hypothetical protein BTO28_12470 [Domibacillus epiphyticus]